jgi:histidinol-phosphate phosphatase family protein
VVIYPDNFSQVDIRAMIEFHRSHHEPATMLLFRADNPRACGIATVDHAGLVTGFVEKPQHPIGNLANAGVYIFNAEAYREIAGLNAKDIGFDILPRFVGRMRGYDFGGFHRDIGTPMDYEHVNAFARELLPSALPPRTGRAAVFMDRDGTIIRQVHYLKHPEDVALLPGAARAITGLQDAGYACVAVTNQSSIGRGELSVDGYREVQAEVDRQLAAEGAKLDGVYFCPVPASTPNRLAIDHPDRKPGPGMLQRAAMDLRLDLDRSWMVGDMVSDVLAGVNAGCKGTVMVRTGHGPHTVQQGQVAGVLIADDLQHASRLILERSTSGVAAT